MLFDVVLGYGSHRRSDRRSCSAPSIRQGQGDARKAARLAFIGYVCGTDQDPQDRDQASWPRSQVAGVLVAPSNAEAATWSA